MKSNISIQFKALALLLVFSLNTVVGFACAVGMDMDMEFNGVHHDKAATKLHVHADGKKHEHPVKAANHHPAEKNKEKKEKSGCCNDDVQKFQRLDKSLNQNAKIAIAQPVAAAIISVFFGTGDFKISKAYPPKYKIRFYYPPPTDIRIAIRSFQI